MRKPAQITSVQVEIGGNHFSLPLTCHIEKGNSVTPQIDTCKSKRMNTTLNFNAMCHLLAGIWLRGHLAYFPVKLDGYFTKI